MSLKVKYWGVRGSISSLTPTQWTDHFSHLLHDFFKEGFRSEADVTSFMRNHTLPHLGGFGTATTCVEVRSPKTQIIIDGGSGIRHLSEEMLRGPAGKGQAEIHIFLTHFHWDHILGIPFFAPHFIKGNRIHYYAVQPELEKIIRTCFQKPMFPVAYEMLPATIEFHQLKPRTPTQIGDMQVSAYKLDHPDPCWGFKIEAGGRAYSHCVDTEGTRSTREQLGEDLPLYQDIDLMYFDAQYTLPELAEKANWGHSAAQIGLDIAFRENIKHVIFTHHDPGASIDQIFELEKQTREYHDWKLSTASTNHTKLNDVQWRFAYEGMLVDLTQL